MFWREGVLWSLIYVIIARSATDFTASVYETLRCGSWRWICPECSASDATNKLIHNITCRAIMSRTLPTGCAGHHNSHAYAACAHTGWDHQDLLLLATRSRFNVCAYVLLCPSAIQSVSLEWIWILCRPTEKNPAATKRRASTGMPRAARKNMTFSLVTLNYVLPHSRSAHETARVAFPN